MCGELITADREKKKRNICGGGDWAEACMTQPREVLLTLVRSLTLA